MTQMVQINQAENGFVVSSTHKKGMHIFLNSEQALAYATTCLAEIKKLDDELKEREKKIAEVRAKAEKKKNGK